ncbi:MAG: trypsin-like peptidase domain-containing protein [Actinobacteria bacterium]|nr:trypsin-like peptidase domain-containing protein [Actinomycetota bacterium]
MNRWAKIALGAAVIFTLAFGVLLALGIRSSHETTPMNSTKVAEDNKPGTVYIETLYDGDITIPNLTVDQQKLINKLLPMVQTGAIANQDDAVQAAINEFLTNPQDYIVPDGGTQVLHVQTGMSGTGFIITPDGYLVTNAHVVQMTDAELKQSMVQVGLTDNMNSFVSGLEQGLGMTLTDDQKQKVVAAVSNIYAQHLTVANTASQSQMFMGVAVPGIGTVQKGQPLEIVKAGQETPGKDVAIMKVNATNLPTVSFGDDSAVQGGQQALALGYPGAATFNPALQKSDQNIKPSLTVGSISGHKTMPGGWDVIQMDTALTHGNSGGPLLNSNGQVIGITTFGSPSDSGQGEVQGFNFAVPTSVVREFLNQTNVKPTQGSLTQMYHDAIDLYSAGHYSAAKNEFKEIADTNPAFPYVSDMIASATQKINAGQDQPLFPYPLYLMILLAACAVIAAGAAVFFILRSGMQKGGAKLVAAPAAGNVTTVSQAGSSPDSGGPGGSKPAPPAAVNPDAMTGETMPAGLAEPKEAVVPEEAPAAQPAAEEEAPAAGPVSEAKPAGEAAETGPAQEETDVAPDVANFCSSCGHPVTPEAKFCPNCAHPVK